MELKRIKGDNRRAVRLHHPTLRNCVFTVEQQSLIYPTPFQCPACKKEHIFKTVHLNLNQHGDVAVTPEAYEMLKADGIAGVLTATKEVTPALTILDMANTQGPPIIVSLERGPVKLPGMNGHGRV